MIARRATGGARAPTCRCTGGGHASARTAEELSGARALADRVAVRLPRQRAPRPLGPRRRARALSSRGNAEERWRTHVSGHDDRPSAAPRAARPRALAMWSRLRVQSPARRLAEEAKTYRFYGRKDGPWSSAPPAARAYRGGRAASAALCPRRCARAGARRRFRRPRVASRFPGWRTCRRRHRLRCAGRERRRLHVVREREHAREAARRCARPSPRGPKAIQAPGTVEPRRAPPHS